LDKTGKHVVCVKVYCVVFIVYQNGDILVTEVGDDVKNKKKKCRSWVRY